jgi:hypothetical protein
MASLIINIENHKRILTWQEEGQERKGLKSTSSLHEKRRERIRICQEDKQLLAGR